MIFEQHMLKIAKKLQNHNNRTSDWTKFCNKTWKQKKKNKLIKNTSKGKKKKTIKIKSIKGCE